MNEKGYVLVLTLLLVIVFLSLGMFLLDHFLVRQQLVHNMYLELKTYYLAQGGIEYVASRLLFNPIWRLQNLKIDLGSNGLIQMTVNLEQDLIHVHSVGTVKKYSQSQDAYFIKSPLVSRVK